MIPNDNLQELKGYVKSVLSTLDISVLNGIKTMLVDDGNSDIQEIKRYIDGRISRLQAQNCKWIKQQIGDDNMENKNMSQEVLGEIEALLFNLDYADLLTLEDLVKVERRTRPEEVNY